MNLSDAPSGTEMPLDEFLSAFEAAYARDGRADPAAFLPPADHPMYARVLRELLRVDLEFAWDRGEERPVEAYWERFPALFADPEGLRAVAWEEFRLRQAAGEAPSPSDYRRRLGVELIPSGPDGDELPKTLALEAVSAEMPKPGEVIRGFEVLSELGCGAFGRVFLARETGLAGRLVALKVSSKLTGESQTLARLQHTNIVPVYSVHRHGHYHIVCMPYLGATTLADLLALFRGAGALPASGKELVSTLADRANRTPRSGNPSADTSPPPASTPADLPDVRVPQAHLERIERLSYVDTVLLLAAQLADGLAHAHERGVLHRDLKPANVLLADDGRPMLLDFNLAADAGADLEPARAGGTLRYMPPEALADLAANRPHADPRADVYALGLILYELLTGTFPYPGPPPGPTTEVLARMGEERRYRPADVSRLRRDVTPAVAAILAKCLDPDPGRRYESAAALREDLRRQLDNRPLKFAPERSARERLAKWARRHPRLSSATTVSAIAALLLALVAGAFVARQREFDRLKATEARGTLLAEREAIRALLVGPKPPVGLCAEAETRSRAVLTPYGAIDDPGWANCPLIRRLAEGDREAARRDVSFVLGDLADALAGLAAAETDPTRRAELFEKALKANEQAACLEDQTTTHRTRRQRVALLRAAGRGDEAAQVERGLSDPADDDEGRVWDDLRGGRYREVIDRFRPLTPRRSYAVWVILGYCHLMLGEPGDAVRCFDSAAALAPDSSAVRFHRGVAFLELGRHREAAADFDALLALHGAEPEALLNRALARLGMNDPAGAVADLDRLERLGTPFTRIFFVREQARRMMNDLAGAERDFRAGLERRPADPASWVARGRAKLRLTPPDAAGALADFEKAVEIDPRLVTGWENMAEVLSERLGRPDEAIRALDRVLALRENHLPARAGRAVLLARAGRREAARKDAERCLEGDAGALILYQIGCVYLLTADGPADHKKGLDLLRACLRKDPSWARLMPADPDLIAVRGTEEFQALIAAAGTLAR